MLGIGLGLSPVPFYTLGIFAPALAQEFHWTFAQIFFGLTCTTAAVLIASPLVGLAADRFGVRRVALTSLVLFSLSYMALGLNTGSLPLYWGMWTFAALVGAGTLPVTWTRAVNNAFNERKGLALGLSLLGTGLFGYAVKPLAAWLLQTVGWRMSFVVIGALPLLIALPVAWFGFKDIGHSNEHSAAERRESLAARAASTPGLTLGETLRQWRFWLLGLSFLSLAFAIGGLIPNMENILKVAHFEPGDTVTLVSRIGLCVIAGRVVGGWLIDRFWAPGVALLLLAAPAAACLLLAQPTLDYNTALLSICLIGVAAGVEYDLLAFLVARYFGLKSYGGIYGMLYGFFALGAGVGPVIYGASFDRTHSYSYMLNASAAFFFVPAVAMLLLGRYRVFSER
jgi:MFS family permease